MNSQHTEIEIELEGQGISVKCGENIRGIFRRHLNARRPRFRTANGRNGGEAAAPAGRVALAAKLNQKVVGLDTCVTYPCRLAPLYIDDREGSAVYRRSACLLLLEAIKELFPGAKAVVGQSLAGGYYFDMHGEAPPLPWALGVIEPRMKGIVAEKRPFATRRVTGEEARRLFAEEGRPDKVQLLDSTRWQDVVLVDCGVHRDVWHGPFVPHAGFIEDFALVSMPPGFILQFPLAANSNETQNHAPDQALFQIHLETKAWNRILGVTNVGTLNGACLSGEIGEVIKIAEGFQEKKVAGFAEDIFSKRDRLRLVLIAGPSSSGKTTFSKRLMVQLRVCGLRPVALGTDSYFLSREETPLGEDGRPDFESLGAVDTRLFNEHLEALLAGKPVQVPTFDFHAGKRGPRAVPMQLGGDDVLIVEGIHSLNPDLTRSVPQEKKLKIYISALTQLTLDDHNRIMTTDVRLIRRIVRDRAFRGYNASKTISMWPSVLRGEKKNIFPFQGEADFMFNSSLVYEPAALRPYAERYLLEVPDDDDSFGEAYRLLNFVRMFAPIFPDEIPRTSILREFIGGSGFEY